MDLSRTLDKIFLTLPNYCLGQCISDFYQNYEFIQFCTSSVEAIFICKAFSESPHRLPLLPFAPPHLQPHWAPCGVGRGLGVLERLVWDQQGWGLAFPTSAWGGDARLSRWLWCHGAFNPAWAVIPVTF